MGLKLKNLKMTKFINLQHVINIPDIFVYLGNIAVDLFQFKANNHYLNLLFWNFFGQSNKIDETIFSTNHDSSKIAKMLNQINCKIKNIYFFHYL